MNSKNMSQRKIDGYLKLAEIIQWGRKNPVKFVERKQLRLILVIVYRKFAKLSGKPLESY